MLATGKSVLATGIGNVTLYSKHAEIILCDVLYIPQLHSNIISVSKIISKGLAVSFENGKATIKKDNNNIVEAN